MARHRINENGHMMWFDSDEEYEQYQWKKTKRVLLVIAAIIVFYGIAYLFSPKDKEQKSQGTAITTGEYQEKNEQISKPNSKTEEGQLTDFNVYDNTVEKLVPEIEPMSQLEVTAAENTETYVHDQGIEMENDEEKEEWNDFSRQKVYDIAEVMPAFPGGDYELIRYIEDNLDYPKDAMESGIEGRVFVKIIVEPDGSISNAKIIRGLGYGCDEEAIRVIELMPNWEPGRKNGEVVRVTMAVPVNFELQ